MDVHSRSADIDLLKQLAHEYQKELTNSKF